MLRYRLNCNDGELTEIYYKYLCEEMGKIPNPKHDKIEYPILIYEGGWLDFTRRNKDYDILIDTFEEFRKIIINDFNPRL